MRAGVAGMGNTASWEGQPRLGVLQVRCFMETFGLERVGSAPPRGSPGVNAGRAPRPVLIRK